MSDASTPPTVSEAMREAVKTYRQHCSQVFRQLKENEIWLIEGFAYGPIASALAALERENATLRASAERMEAALEPFAGCACTIEARASDVLPVAILGYGPSRWTITNGHIRAARAALTPKETPDA